MILPGLSTNRHNCVTCYMIEHLNQKVKLNINAMTTLASKENTVEPSIMVNQDNEQYPSVLLMK